MRKCECVRLGGDGKQERGARGQRMGAKGHEPVAIP